MRVVTVSPVVRLLIAGAVGLVLAGGVAAAGSGSPTPATPPTPTVRPASLAPHGAAGRLTQAQVRQDLVAAVTARR